MLRFHQPEVIQNLTGIDHPARARPLPRPASSCGLECPHDGVLDDTATSQSNVDLVGIPQERGQPSRDFLNRVHLVRPGLSLHSLQAQPRSAPQLRLRIAGTGEDLHSGLRASHQDRNTPRFHQPREVEEFTVGYVRALRITRRMLDRRRW